MLEYPLRRLWFVLTLIAIGGCGGTPAAGTSALSAAKLAHWTAFVHTRRPLDLAGPRRDGALVLAADARMKLLRSSGAVRAFPGGYLSPGGGEPYIALSPGGCFGNGAVYALRLASGRGVDRIGAGGAVKQFATLTAPGLINGIAFDRTGRFGHRLLVTINAGTKTTVDAIGCHGAVSAITSNAPRMEGGIAVAPRSFGRFAGDLIAPDELSGRIYAVTPSGKSVLVANSGLPHGQDVGVESVGFVPSGARDALVADRISPGNAHPGDDFVLRIRAAALRAVGVQPGDLLVASEGGGLTDAISCSVAGCRVRYVANGPAIAHVEGHIAFAR